MSSEADTCQSEAGLSAISAMNSQRRMIKEASCLFILGGIRVHDMTYGWRPLISVFDISIAGLLPTQQGPVSTQGVHVRLTISDAIDSHTLICRRDPISPDPIFCQAPQRCVVSGPWAAGCGPA